MSKYKKSGDFCWFDIKSGDPEQTGRFTSEIFTWRTAVDINDWRQATKVYVGAAVIGSIGDVRAPIYPAGTPPHIAFYIKVEDADEAVSASIEHGAAVILPVINLEGSGRLATLRDPQGAGYSVWQCGSFQGSAQQAIMPGSIVGHILATREPTRASEFYCSVFGWSITEKNEPEALSLLTPGGHIVRVTQSEKEPEWRMVIACANLARSLERARDHGATIEHENGRDETSALTQILTPDGLRFAVMDVRRDGNSGPTHTLTE